MSLNLAYFNNTLQMEMYILRRKRIQNQNEDNIQQHTQGGKLFIVVVSFNALSSSGTIVPQQRSYGEVFERGTGVLVFTSVNTSCGRAAHALPSLMDYRALAFTYIALTYPESLALIMP